MRNSKEGRIPPRADPIRIGKLFSINFGARSPSNNEKRLF